MDDDQVVLYSTRGHVATIMMNRPGMANAQDTALIDGIDHALDLADADDEVRVVILAGKGKHFSSGHDLKELVGDTEAGEWRKMRETPEGKLRHEQVMYVDKCRRLYAFRKPTIAAVQGACVAAGMMLACMCDLIVAADDATFQNPVLRMTGAGVELLVEPWELGVRKAKEFLFTGEKLDAQEAWRLGLVNRVVPLAELTERVEELADRVRWCPRPPPRWSRTPSTRRRPSWARTPRGSTTSWPTTGCTTPRRHCRPSRPAGRSSRCPTSSPSTATDPLAPPRVRRTTA